MFLLTKILAPFLFPVPLVLALLVAGTWLLWRTRRQRAGKVLVTLGTLGLFLASIEPVAHFMVASLEQRFPPLLSVDRVAGSVRWVVVLDSGHVDDPRLPPPAQLDGSTLGSLVEGIRLQRQLPAARLVLSGGRVFNRTAAADVMADVARILGVSASDVVVDPLSRDTRENAERVRAVVTTDPFLLVTSASHMPRAMAIFRRAGMHPVAAPASRIARRSGVWRPDSLHPSAYNLVAVQRAFYEYIGLAWLRWARH